MEAYTSFAQVYDLFQDNVPYGEWGDYLVSLLAEYGVRRGILLDLGCGTGSMTRLLADRGFDMIGVDGSEDMLEIAVEKKREDDSILYLCQDMRSFELYGTVAAAVSVCDCLNYITDLEDLTEVFRLVNNYLDPGGVFIFDVNTPWKYETLLADRTFAEVREESSFIWENFYDPEDKINEYDLTLFIREEGGLYRRFSETHYQRSYTLEEIKASAEAAGLRFEAAYDGYTKEPVREDSERISIVLREQGKTREEIY